MLFIILLLLTICFTNCVREIHHVDQKIVIDGKYDSEFPHTPSSDKFEEIMRSVKLVNSICTYESYDFDKKSLITNENLSDSTIKNHFSDKRYFSKPATGTGTVIYFTDNKIALLTCAHIIDFPDTIIHHYKDKEGEKTVYIRNISIKIRQLTNVLRLPEIKNYEIIAIDKKKDIALVGKKLTITPIFPIPVLDVKTGAAKDLNWGSIVYLFGYPRGTQMITNCIVSDPDRDRYHSFIINAVSARGISGGIILAIRDGIPNFELVGMAKAVAAENVYYLSPEEEFNMSAYDISRAYKDEIFVTSHEMIYYGILYTISIESILDFIDKSETILKSQGYNKDYFFK